MHRQTEGIASVAATSSVCETAWPQALLFDLDGTLIDSAPDIAAAVNILLQLHGHAPLRLPEVRSMIGNGVRKLVQRAFAARDVVLDRAGLGHCNDEMMTIYREHLTVLTTKMPGADLLLKAAHSAGVPIAVVTNKPEDFSAEIIARFGWSRFVDCLVGGDTGPEPKPAPDMLHHACRQLRVEPRSAVMVGDGPPDIDAARAACVNSIAVRGGYTNVPVEELGADLIVDSLADVPKALVGLAAHG